MNHRHSSFSHTAERANSTAWIASTMEISRLTKIHQKAEGWGEPFVGKSPVVLRAKCDETDNADSLHLQPVFAQAGHQGEGKFPLAEAAAKRVMSLPMGPDLTETEQQSITVTLCAASSKTEHHAVNT